MLTSKRLHPFSRTGCLITDGTLLYTGIGLVWNPANGGQIVATYPVPAATILDSVIPDTSTFLPLMPPSADAKARTRSPSV